MTSNKDLHQENSHKVKEWTTIGRKNKRTSKRMVRRAVRKRLNLETEELRKSQGKK